MIMQAESSTAAVPTYDQAVFDGIYSLCGAVGEKEPFSGRFLEMRADGVFAREAGFDELDWMPVVDIDAPGSPNPLSAPLLPFPFTAAELAAFMLGGWGWFVHAAFGNWEAGPDEVQLSRLGTRATKVNEAMRAAYQAYREAERVVGKLDEGPQARVADLGSVIEEANTDANKRELVNEMGISHDEYTKRRARARNATVDLVKEHEEISAQASKMRESWRRDMVRQLLCVGNAAAAAGGASIGVLPSVKSSGDTAVVRPVQHSTRDTRRDLLWPLIEEAQVLCADPLDTHRVWVNLEAMAEKGVKPLQNVEEEGIKYVLNGQVKFFTRKNLRDRLSRRAKTR